MITNLQDFRLASVAHLAGAQRLLEDAPADKGGPLSAKLPSSAAYLASVSLECSIKARLLFRGGYESDDALKTKLPGVYKVLFKSKEGHDLAKLAEELRLPAFVRAEGKTWTEDAVWKRMTTPDRPYSLRYGTEHLDRAAATAEVKRAEEISATLLNGLRTALKRRSKR